jgi:hypothetical protein
MVDRRRRSGAFEKIAGVMEFRNGGLFAARSGAYGALRTRSTGQIVALSSALTPARTWTAARDLSCRFGTSYPRASVSFQREKIRSTWLAAWIRARCHAREYFEELASSKAVISPFGYGEITLKDFEVFLTGGILIKPDMSNIETWPDLFRVGETMLAHDWDLSDFDAVVDRAHSGYDCAIAIARSGQNEYRRHLIGEEAETLFCRQFSALLH